MSVFVSCSKELSHRDGVSLSVFQGMANGFLRNPRLYLEGYQQTPGESMLPIVSI